MSVSLKSLVDDTNQYLGIDQIKDYCPNGLQVEGRAQVSSILGGVTASQALIDKALETGADAILVHHGFFWKGEDACITGIKRKRLKVLLENNISLLAYHLPLDMHSEVGNNVQLAARLGIEITGPLDIDAAQSIGLVGQLSKPVSAVEFKALVDRVLGRECLHIGYQKMAHPEQDAANQQIKTIGWCTGGAQGMIELAVARGVDAYLSGEISEPTVHIARETGTHYFAAGHHATERYGVQALGNKLAAKFDLDFQFLDIDNPV